MTHSFITVKGRIKMKVVFCKAWSMLQIYTAIHFPTSFPSYLEVITGMCFLPFYIYHKASRIHISQEKINQCMRNHGSWQIAYCPSAESWQWEDGDISAKDAKTLKGEESDISDQSLRTWWRKKEISLKWKFYCLWPIQVAKHFMEDQTVLNYKSKNMHYLLVAPHLPAFIFLSSSETPHVK